MYRQLAELQGRVGGRGLAILAFPCNQFGGQEPGTGPEVEAWVREKYGAAWHCMDKIDVNGAAAHPLFAFLKVAQPGFLINAVKWNFTKFLINREGVPVARCSPSPPLLLLLLGFLLPLLRRFGPKDNIVPMVEDAVEKVL